MITFKLNGQDSSGRRRSVYSPGGRKIRVEIPTLCHHKALEPAGMCRICTVELFDGRRTRFVTACNYPIWEGMEVTTDSETSPGAQADRRNAAGRCPEVPLLQKLAKEYGIEAGRVQG
jgi:heterodisulfide reductase subunit A